MISYIRQVTPRIAFSSAAARHCLQVNSDQWWLNSLGLSRPRDWDFLASRAMGGAPSLILPNLWLGGDGAPNFLMFVRMWWWQSAFVSMQSGMLCLIFCWWLYGIHSCFLFLFYTIIIISCLQYVCHSNCPAFDTEHPRPANECAKLRRTGCSWQPGVFLQEQYHMLLGRWFWETCELAIEVVAVAYLDWVFGILFEGRWHSTELRFSSSKGL